MSLNRVSLIGNLGADPDIRYTQEGDPVAILSLATTDKWKDKTTGQPQEKTEWHRVVFFGNQAKTLGEYTKKGAKLYVEGALETKKWEKDGVTRYSTQIKGRGFEFMSSSNQGQGGGNTANNAPSTDKPAQAPAADFGSFDDDIPF